MIPRSKYHLQGFLNSNGGVGGGEGRVLWRIGIGNFEGEDYQVEETWGDVILAIWTFSKLKTALCEYWTSIKIKINIT